MNGILIVDKVKGLTSHDVVDFIRKRFVLKKVGHSGTLDPMAEGVLVILIGKATKLSSKFTNQDKEYEATLTLGVVTDTGDSEGKIISQNPYVNKYSTEEIQSVFKGFVGEIEQIPPMVSALKHKGRRMYELARKGIEVKREARRVKILKLKINNIDLPHISFTVNCSKGTYIRTLAEDIGKKLGCGGSLSQLKRTCSGPFSINEAVSLESLNKASLPQLKQLLVYETN